MATIEDLNYRSLTEMSVDEAIEHLRQIRLSRRTPTKTVKKTKKSTTKKPTELKLSKDQAKRLLKQLEGIE